MSESNDNTADVLIGRVADGDLHPETWSEWTQHADADPSQWRAMAESLRDEMVLRLLAGRVRMTASAVDIDDVESSADSELGGRPRATMIPQSPARHRPTRATERIRSAGGWMAALVLLALFASGRFGGDNVPTVTMTNGGETGNGTMVAGPGGVGATQTPKVSSAAEAFDLFVEHGREEGLVLEVVPTRFVVETRPDPSGRGLEVIYERVIRERTLITEPPLRPTGVDERGRLAGFSRRVAAPRQPM